jgi:metal-responsive CopG/Arc/MetJ family transcriptional regulator
MKKRFSISMNEDIVTWLDEMIDRKIFSSRSHAIEFCLSQFCDYPMAQMLQLIWGEGDADSLFDEHVKDAVERIIEKKKESSETSES